MRKSYALLFLLISAFSCSDIDTPDTASASQKKSAPGISRLDPTKLSRVVFYPGTNHERTWFFNHDGLLKKIVQNNGTLIQSFVYDNHNNLIQTQFFGDPFFIGNPYLYTFGYDGNNRINAINGNPITYNAATNSYLSGTSYIRMLNSDYLLTSESYDYTFNDIDNNGNPITITETVAGLTAGYENQNLRGCREHSSPSGTHYQHDTKINPLKAGLLPICRALQLTSFNSAYGKWMKGEYNSLNNIIKRFYDAGDPESDRFEYIYNTNNLPVSQTRKSYYFNTLETTSLDILYYYQGDVIP